MGIASLHPSYRATELALAGTTIITEEDQQDYGGIAAN
jgi:hypothetical protein